jgi:hypothetical protein
LLVVLHRSVFISCLWISYLVILTYLIFSSVDRFYSEFFLPHLSHSVSVWLKQFHIKKSSLTLSDMSCFLWEWQSPVTNILSQEFHSVSVWLKQCHIKKSSLTLSDMPCFLWEWQSPVTSILVSSLYAYLFLFVFTIEINDDENGLIYVCLTKCRLLLVNNLRRKKAIISCVLLNKYDCDSVKISCGWCYRLLMLVRRLFWSILLCFTQAVQFDGQGHSFHFTHRFCVQST